MQMTHIISHLDDNRRRKIGEILRFGIVGVLATLLQYAIYRGLIFFVPADATPARAQVLSSVCMTIGYGVSFVFNFFASTRFAFSHAVNYLMQMATLIFFLWIGLSNAWAPVPMFCICVPINFILVRFFLKR